MKVLFCTDGSKISYTAMQNFSNWFDNFSVYALSVADWSCLSDNVLAQASSVVSKCQSNANSVLNYTQDFLASKNIEFGGKINSCGSVVDVILETEKDEEYSYIVMGSNGKKGLQRWLGSVSQEVSSLSKSSVYISKQNMLSNKVVFALDSSLISSSRLTNTLQNIDLSEKEIHLITVYEIPDFLFLEGNIDQNWVVDVDQKQKTEGMFLLSQYEKIFRDFGYDICIKNVLSGNYADEIIKYCDDNEVGLVVCGMKTKNYFTRLLPGSISRRILENVKSDVLIMK